LIDTLWYIWVVRGIPNSNRVFANITKIKEARDKEDWLKRTWEHQDRALEARRTTDKMLTNKMARFQHKFHVAERSEVVGVSLPGCCSKWAGDLAGAANPAA
jgi:hypothetical protein